jgi:sec-independent protein translocase protein TatA
MGLGALQPGHLIVVLVIVLLIFGPGKLPELGKAVGDGLRELKKAGDEDPSRDSARLATTATITPIGAVVSPHVCLTCGGGVSAADKFCGNCGASITAIA